jgi:hypothetical protein
VLVCEALGVASMLLKMVMKQMTVGNSLLAALLQ